MVTRAPDGREERCAFCDVVAGDAPAEVVWSDDATVAFLDHRPLFRGHTLLVPRRHVVTIGDLDDEDVGPLFRRVRRLSIAVRDALGAEGTFVALNNVVSQSVPHLHVHVVPRVRGDGLRGFFWPRTTYADGDMARVGSAIRAAVNDLGHGAAGAGR